MLELQVEETGTLSQELFAGLAEELTDISAEDGKLSNPIPALQQKLDAILFLCDKARMFEAANDADEHLDSGQNGFPEEPQA